MVIVWLYRSWYFSTAGKGSRYLLPQVLGLAHIVPPIRELDPRLDKDDDTRVEEEREARLRFREEGVRANWRPRLELPKEDIVHKFWKN